MRSSSSRITAPGRRRTMPRYSSAKLTPPMSMNATITQRTVEPNAPIDCGSGEKPPVGIVVSAWATALKRSMAGSTPVQPSTARITASVTVRPR